MQLICLDFTKKFNFYIILFAIAVRFYTFVTLINLGQSMTYIYKILKINKRFFKFWSIF